MRIGVMLGVMLAVMMALGSPAVADSPRYRPAPGTTFTYRLLVTVNMNGHAQTLGQIYRVKTTADDGAIAQGTLTPVALVWLCPDSDTSTICKQAQKFPDVRREDDLIIAPLPAEISSELGKIGKMTVRDLLHVTQVYPIPGPQESDDMAKPQIGSTPLSVQTTALDCDETAIRPFFPLGSAAQATVPCKMIVEIAQSRVAAAKDGKQSHDVTYELSFAGHERVAVPAGAYEVAVIKFKSRGGPGRDAETEGEWEFIESLGVSAKYSALTRFGNSTNTTRFVRELIKVEQ